MPIKIYLTTIIIAVALCAIVSCSGGEMEQNKISYSNLQEVPDATWEKLSTKSFYFGHQSVGWNILKGVKEIMDDHPHVKFIIKETAEPKSINPGIIAHSHVGKNTDPKSKIEDFVKFIDNGIGKKVDGVALKFCYVDIFDNTNPQQMFTEYANAVEKIRKEYTELKIIHFTVPLTTLQTGPKAWIKKIIGRPIRGIKENINRYKYNHLLVDKYYGKDPILDIAKIESTYPDGSRKTFNVDGQSYYSMVPEYTDDGGHLNKLGRKQVAEQFILLLANI